MKWSLKQALNLSRLSNTPLPKLSEPEIYGAVIIGGLVLLLNLIRIFGR